MSNVIKVFTTLMSGLPFRTLHRINCAAQDNRTEVDCRSKSLYCLSFTVKIFLSNRALSTNRRVGISDNWWVGVIYNHTNTDQDPLERDPRLGCPLQRSEETVPSSSPYFPYGRMRRPPTISVKVPCKWVLLL